ncbi:MAG: helix-turn-helix domain-containing protein, partial [Candidatus Dormibacteria bacterium]
MSQATLADQVGVTQSMISKFETGRDTPTGEMMSRLGDALGLTAETIATLIDQVAELSIEIRTIRVHGRHGQLRVQGQIGEEEAALNRLWVYQAAIIPGLLQVPEYTAALLPVMGVEPASHTELLAGRAHRQRVLYDEGRTFRFLLTESVLRTRVAPVPVMRAQLRRLTALVDGFPHIQIAVIPTGRRLHRWTMTSFDVVGDLVSVELKAKEVRLRDPVYLATYISLFDEMWAEAITGPALTGVVRDIDRWLADFADE